MTIGAVFAGLIISFVYGPVFAIICFGYFPIVMIFGIIFGRSIKGLTMAKIGAVKKLGGVVEETLSSVKLVASFN